MNRNLISNFGHGSRLTLSLFIAILVLVSNSNSFAAPPPPEDMVFETVSLPPEALSIPAGFVTGAQVPSNPKLDSTMAGLSAAAKDSVAEALNLAQSQSLRLSSNQVHVQILTHASGLENTIAAVVEASGEVTGVGNDDTLVQGWLPVEALGAVAAEDDVYLIRRPAEVVLLEDLTAGNSTTEGLAVMNGPAWHAAGYTGAGVKVGVIDGGFEGYTSLLGTDLPASVTVKNFVDSEDDSDIDDDGDSLTENHGLACAEIIHDIAPDATLYLAKVSTNLDLQEAVTWLKDTHGVDVISTSLGWYNLTPGDGTGEFADLVEDARDAGILWVTAASNDREAHWGGLYSDPDTDDFHNFDGSQEVNFFGDGTGGVYSIYSGHQFAVYVRWNDWTNVNQDYDLHLLRWNGSGWGIIASSTNPQNGGPAQTPTEFAVGTTTGDATYYGFIIERVNSTQDVNFEVFVPKFLRPDEIVHARSLSNLADAPDAMTVAALDVTSPYPQESYSSEGPTNGSGGAETGGFTKPDISGYANVSTESYGAGGFNGTSAATPHVAGTAALVLSAYPSYTPAQVQSFLEGRAIDKGSSGMDTLYGYGRLYLDSAPSATGPTVTNITPDNGVNTGTVSVSVAGSNFQSGATVKLTKSGQSDINATSVVVVSNSQITCDFGLTGAATGAWNVVVTNPDSQSGTRSNGFTVNAPGDEDFFVYLPMVIRNWPPPQTVKLYPEADATVLQGTANSNWGSMTTLRVGYDYSGCYDSVNGKIGRALVRFNLSSIPAGAAISEAKLHLYLGGYCYYTGHSQARTVTVYRANSSWSESGVTWNNQPGYTSPSTPQSVAVNSFGWHTFDVTGLVEGWVSGSYANNGVVVRAPETSGDDFVRLEYAARENSGTIYDPYLEVTYVGGSVSAQVRPAVEEVPAQSPCGSYQSVLGISPSPLEPELEPLDCARMTFCSPE